MIAWIKDRLVPEARVWWKLWSVRLNAAGLAVLSFLWFDPVSALSLYNMMPLQVQDMVPPDALRVLAVALFALSTVSRFVSQPKVTARVEQD